MDSTAIPHELKQISIARPIVVLPLVLFMVIGQNRGWGQSPSHLQRIRTDQRRIEQHVEQLRAATVGVKLGTVNASGFVVDGGYVVTSGHAANRLGQQARVFLLAGSERSAVVHAIDRTTDVTLLKLDDPTGLPTVGLRATALNTPEPVIAIGNPGGFQKERPSLVRFGTASGTAVLQSTCRIARGDSGGPLFDLDGNVIGIHRQIRIDAAQNYHTSAVSVRRHWNRLLAGGLIEGTPPAARRLELEERNEIRHAASRAVVRIYCGPHRAILGTVINGKRGLIITKASELTSPLTVGVGNTRVDAAIVGTDSGSDLALLQAKADFAASLPLGRTPRATKVGQIVLTGLPGVCRTGILGSAARKIDQQRGELGLVLSEALEIERIQPNSAARAAGAEVGDRVVAVGPAPVDSTRGLAALLSQFNPGDPLVLKVVRNQQNITLTMKLRHPARTRFDDKAFQLGAGGASSQRRSGFPSVLQHDCLFAAEQCGSPVVSLDGRLVGINIAKVGREAAYCVPAHLIQRFVADCDKSTNADQPQTRCP